MSGEVAFGQADLSTCDREPIHVPGSIQPHGVLFAVHPEGMTVAHVSANVASLLGHPAETFLDTPLRQWVDLPEQLDKLEKIASAKSFKRVNPLPLRMAGRPFQAIVHRSDDLLLVELEPEQEADGSFRDFSTDTSQAMFALQSAETLSDLIQAATDEIRRISGFDRVMVYRFDADGHGEVAAESKREDLNALLGQHYPESDIPAQARRLYLLNWLRIIVDAQYTPSPLIPAVREGTKKPIDLSYSVLRSVSPIHLEYLANMGVKASMSISLIQDGKLWGMVACHHYAPHFVPYHVRMSCEFLGQSLSFLIASKSREEESHRKLEMGTVSSTILQNAATDGDVHAALIDRLPNLLDLVDAGGVCVRFESRTSCRGEVPPVEAVEELIEWLATQGKGEVFATDSIAKLVPSFEKYKDIASGVMAIAFSKEQGNYAMWFRPEVVRTIRWAGDPNAGVKAGPLGTRLTPRGSFQEWTEQTRLRSLHWAPWQLDLVTELRSALLSLALKRAGEIERTRELFLGMLGHDLRNPLGAISLSAQTMSLKGEMSEAALKSTARIAASSNRMKRMVEQILDFTRARVGGGLQLVLTEVPLATLVQQLIEEVQTAHPGTVMTLKDEGVGTVQCDADRLAQVVSNLLSNARHHGRHGAAIDVVLSRSGEDFTISVTNQGTPIPAHIVPSLFDPFRQGGPKKANQGGLGLGLFIVKKIVDAHHGNIDVVSNEDIGTRFSVRFPRRQPATA